MHKARRNEPEGIKRSSGTHVHSDLKQERTSCASETQCGYLHGNSACNNFEHWLKLCGSWRSGKEKNQPEYNGLCDLHCLINNAYCFLGKSKIEHNTLRENYFVGLLTISNLIENLLESNFTEDLNSFFLCPFHIPNLHRSRWYYVNYCTEKTFMEYKNNVV